MSTLTNGFDGCSNQVLVWCASTEEIVTADMRNYDSEWKFYLNEMTSTVEKMKIMSFLFEADQKRALVSILMQKAIIRDHLIITDDSGYSIERTPENKPYAMRTTASSSSSSSRSLPLSLEPWNYNVSHHGIYVCVASHPTLMVGVDLVDVTARSWNASSFTQYFSLFEKCFGVQEKEFIFKGDTEDDQYCHFYILWALKESYVKAIGLGLGFELRNVEFTVNHTMSRSLNADGNFISKTNGDGTVSRVSRGRGRGRSIRGSATAKINSCTREDWSFDECYLIAVALGTGTGTEIKDPGSLPVPVSVPAKTGAGMGIGMMRGLGIGLSKCMGIISSSTITSADTNTSAPLTPATSPPLSDASSSSSSSLTPIAIECHFKSLRSLFTPALGAHYDRVFPTIEHPPCHILDITQLGTEIDQQNAVFDFNENCEKCEKCDFACSIL